MNYALISKIPLFHSVEEKELVKIFSELNIFETRFEKEVLLALQDEPCNRLIILLTGSVKAEMIDSLGRVIKVEDVFAPNPLAILFLFGKNNRFPVQIIARENVSALVISKQSILRMLGMNQVLLKNYLDISAEFAWRLSQKLHFMSFRTIRQKLSMYILKLSKEVQSDEVELDKTKSDLAEYFGVARPSLERELSLMQQEGLISVEKKKIKIKNKNKFNKLTLV
ncbi:MAG: Crp/Fnr family transcriptional regulator [Prevotellaceae bacterium]|jgi:CRP-like cAMP-binding protein|nr:Crp/Fnr family transcriptional regulator [Prevotellaceae bacterium]